MRKVELFKYCNYFVMPSMTYLAVSFIPLRYGRNRGEKTKLKLITVVLSHKKLMCKLETVDEF